DVNRSISSLTSQELLDIKTIKVGDEIETIIDASPVLEKLDQLVTKSKEQPVHDEDQGNQFKQIVSEFERELGRFLSPFELEDLEKTVKEDKTDIDLIREALKEAVFNGKTNWKYIQAILRNWRKEGITNLYQVEERKRAREEVNMSQVSLSDDFLSAMNLWSD
ncbi:TPA: DnaD domain-containing protein, partial [Escherichia coli]